jgi:hypothetical protein
VLQGNDASRFPVEQRTRADSRLAGRAPGRGRRRSPWSGRSPCNMILTPITLCVGAGIRTDTVVNSNIVSPRYGVGPGDAGGSKRPHLINRTQHRIRLRIANCGPEPAPSLSDSSGPAYADCSVWRDSGPPHLSRPRDTESDEATRTGLPVRPERPTGGGRLST